MKGVKSSAIAGVTLAWLVGCATTAVAPLPSTVHRIAVLPPNRPSEADKTPASASLDGVQPARLTVADVLAADARVLLAQKGFQVVDPTSVETATHGRVPTSPRMAAEIVADAHLDATALYIEVPVWQTNTDSSFTASAVIVALNVRLVDSRGEVVWQVRRPTKPVPLYGTILTGQADVLAAEAVMREVLAPLGPAPGGS
jgi:hypothetical protein